MDDQNIMEREGGQDAMQQNAGDGDDDEDDDTEQEKLVPLQEASEEEALSHKNFQSLNSEELALLYKLMVRLQLATPDRTTRRKKRGRKGEHMDMRRTLRKSLHTGGDPIVLSRKKRRIASAPARAAVRHLGLDGALRARVPAVPARGSRDGPLRGGVRLRHASDAADAPAGGAQPAAGDPPRDGGGARTGPAARGSATP